MGQNITWVAPYQFNQRLPFDLDYKVIGTFKEFYVSLLRFVNFKLYKDLEVTYPPTFIQGVSASVTDETLYLNSKQIHELQEIAQKKFARQYSQSIEDIGVSEEFKNTPEMIELTKKHE
jgi:pescadillo